MFAASLYVGMTKHTFVGAVFSFTASPVRVLGPSSIPARFGCPCFSPPLLHDIAQFA